MRTKDIKLIIDKDLDRNKDIKNHLFFVQRISNSLPRCSSFSCRTFLDGKSSGCFAIW